MEDDLRQIVYLSRAQSGMCANDLKNIHEVSVAANAGSGVTGLLLFDGARFIQALEGRGEAVRATMARIMNDHRHMTVQIAADRHVLERQFGNWAMDYKITPPGTCSVSFLEQVKANVDAVTDPALKAAFIGFARIAIVGQTRVSNPSARG